jgi:hypothetical protein
MGTNLQKELYASSSGSGARAHLTLVLDPSLHVATSHASFSFVESYTRELYCSLLQNAVSRWLKHISKSGHLARLNYMAAGNQKL